MIYRLGEFHFPDAVARLYPDTAERPWALEIGFGDGRFWPQYAQTFGAAPNYLGVELSGVSLLKAARRLTQAGLSNAHLTKLPATPLLREVVPAGALSQIIVNFPDPWPKAEHEDHRLLRADFFRLAASRLQVGGAVLLTTDHDEYFDFACHEAEKSGVMRVERAEAPAAAAHTKYALKWQGLGLSAQHARFVATSQPDYPHTDIQPFPQDIADHLEDTRVPHAILERLPATLTFDDLFAHFQRQTQRGTGTEPYTVVLLDAYRSLRRDEFTVLAHVVEGELTQEVLVNVTQREGGTVLVRLGKFGGPIITPAVKAAVGTLTDWLVSQGAKVQHLGY
ncbi:tRNA (guanine-N7)-methyltransferase [Deinococcus psychrotolerans]|uniref:tRNA (guanine-N(7)-)-methyltransferase n=1 Tax=Deinococcus psychrotolerans TaxID=2489213 RepID=A0A3G8YE63_9DEIO|nr:tRNA (guanine-N7)-methyltransferase [Deinococcus psychrotolerans]AZI43602.1 tRNA (guanine-N7)-methyltransferase [Deinococcus psychrotolerans]